MQNLMQKKYDWKPSKEPFERTYRNFSNLDNRYSNGASDLLKFIKFGYGRCTDHASKDIRNGYINREKGVELVKKYDHIVSKDLDFWLDYVGMKKELFWKTADKFRDPRVWSIRNKEWYKDNLWGKESAYGEVYLNDDEIYEFNEKKKKLHNIKI